MIFSFLIVDHIPVKGNKDYQSVDLTNINKLMIVAHPDDETLWGGGHLLEEDYLVVCITCGRSRTRANEFEKVMKETNDAYIMLGYKDAFFNMKSKWVNIKENIEKDIQDILNLKDWQVVVTHNPEGEYGHLHHILTSNIVTEVYHGDNLYYFGHYYHKNNISEVIDELIPLNEKTFRIKKDILLKNYRSQFYPKNKHRQMMLYENWVKKSEW